MAECIVFPPLKPRLFDWDRRLVDFVRSRLSSQFCYGVNDCCLFAADCVAAMTGVDLAASIRGTYTTQRAATQLIKSIGGRGGLYALACAALGDPLPSTMFAQRGDVVLACLEGTQLLGICLGEVWAAPAPDELALRPMTEALNAWRI